MWTDLITRAAFRVGGGRLGAWSTGKQCTSFHCLVPSLSSRPVLPCITPSPCMPLSRRVPLAAVLELGRVPNFVGHIQPEKYVIRWINKWINRLRGKWMNILIDISLTVKCSSKIPCNVSTGHGLEKKGALCTIFFYLFL